MAPALVCAPPTPQTRARAGERATATALRRRMGGRRISGAQGTGRDEKKNEKKTSESSRILHRCSLHARALRARRIRAWRPPRHAERTPRLWRAADIANVDASAARQASRSRTRARRSHARLAPLAVADGVARYAQNITLKARSLHARHSAATQTSAAITALRTFHALARCRSRSYLRSKACIFSPRSLATSRHQTTRQQSASIAIKKRDRLKADILSPLVHRCLPCLQVPFKPWTHLRRRQLCLCK